VKEKIIDEVKRHQIEKEKEKKKEREESEKKTSSVAIFNSEAAGEFSWVKWFVDNFKCLVVMLELNNVKRKKGKVIE